MSDTFGGVAGEVGAGVGVGVAVWAPASPSSKVPASTSTPTTIPTDAAPAMKERRRDMAPMSARQSEANLNRPSAPPKRSRGVPEEPAPLRHDAPMTRVLVVDDEPAVRAALERALRLEAYEVELAADGREALDRLAAGPLDAVVLDVAMPHVDGLEVCRRLRGVGDRTPVLMLTARDAIDDRVAGLDAGADDYLVKPFALKELKARL